MASDVLTDLAIHSPITQCVSIEKQWWGLEYANQYSSEDRLREADNSYPTNVGKAIKE